MKKFIPLIALSLAVLFGCNQNEVIPTDIQNAAESNAFVLSMDGDSPSWEPVLLELDELEDTQGSLGSASVAQKNGNSEHAHGNFPGVEFSGTENNGGAHGTATLNLGSKSFVCETECINIVGNEAIYGGIITAYTGPPQSIGIGDYLYFKVTDNGQGNNAAADQFTGVILYRRTSGCHFINPNGPFWSRYNDFDVPAPGSIKINN